MLMKQEVFDKVAVHLLKQGDRSKSDFNGRERCAYRGRNGRMCAAGILIDDDKYNESAMEGRSVNSAEVESALIQSGVPPSALRLVGALQSVHDYVHPDGWGPELRYLAGFHGVSAVVLDAPVEVNEASVTGLRTGDFGVVAASVGTGKSSLG